jgi:hypothetical protein
VPVVWGERLLITSEDILITIEVLPMCYFFFGRAPKKEAKSVMLLSAIMLQFLTSTTVGFCHWFSRIAAKKVKYMFFR